jgi:PAS domain S-box-containing protein
MRGTLLLADGNERRRHSTLQALGDAGFRVLPVGSAEEGLRWARAVDLVILSLSLPGTDGQEVARRIKSDPVTSHLPVLQLAEPGDLASLRYQGSDTGADAFLVWPFEPQELTTAVRTLLHMKRLAFDLVALKKAQTEAAQLARIVQTAEDAIISISLDGQVLSWNRGAEKLYGYGASEMIGQSAGILFPADRAGELEENYAAAKAGRSLDRYETVRLPKSGEAKPVLVSISPLRDQDDRVIGFFKISHDLSEVKKARELEEQFRQAQRLESLGRLAGGVAHDFNNLLMIISGYAQITQERLAPDDALRRNTQQILKAAERAAGLTRQLLAFSRRQVLAPQVMDINNVVEDTARMIKRLIGEDVEFSVQTGPLPLPIRADPSQITQVLLNLCVNARDAMPSGRKLRIETRNDVVDVTAAAGRCPPGPCVVLTVSDTGTGMTKEVQRHLFEPFFTTKPVGKGTGLGLASVYGVVKQSGGYISVQSTVGEGSSFQLFFPKVDQPVAASIGPDIPDVTGRGETILIAEDESPLRAAVVDYLVEIGYVVLQGANGEEALEAASHHTGPIDVLVTDVIMPRMSGAELAKHIRSLHPELQTVYMSGHTDESIVAHGVLLPGVAFLHKPFILRSLAVKLREMLASRSENRSTLAS